MHVISVLRASITSILAALALELNPFAVVEIPAAAALLTESGALL
jgi:hypothetical protein